jgi:hypothetical protein
LDLGEAKFALGILIEWNLIDKMVALGQTVLINRLVSQFRLTEADNISTPMIQGLKLWQPDPQIPLSYEELSCLAQMPYHSLVGSLMYVAIGTYLDIAYTVSKLTSFFNCYQFKHWEAVIQVLRYLKGAKNMHLVLGGPSITPISYSDSNYANCLNSRCSVSGYVFFLGLSAFSWGSQKQRTVADSSTVAEYITISEASQKCVWIRQFLSGIDILPLGAIMILCDNDAI